MSKYIFDDSHIKWQKFGEFENFRYCILNIDHVNKVIDVIFKFAANDPIFLHRHCALNHTFVIHGEHHLYHANGELKEMRPVGSYTASPADITPHRECGGDEGTIVLFSIRGTDGLMYEILDDNGDTIAALGMQDFIGLYEMNKTPISETA
ncbi:regulator [Methylophaga pinxianii]|uniref:regulator n=1 Tax=Methylophaga pinxianii TaxID=2881052 RepID=UPI001CF2D5DB|nr:regulator [Methylophaga pinxianii]MCB2427940.1 regulator [Methylophaga pinxianii]UPH44431.1 regulator [Methylophaga pinxianii]